MCANYVPVTSMDRMLQYFGVVRDRDEPPHDIYPMGQAPFLRLALPGEEPNKGPAQQRIVEDGIFRFVPDFATKEAWASKTYNARSETVEKLPTYKRAWANGQRCVIPAEAIYEPNYESGGYERWKIRKGNGEPMGIAGIYREWTKPNGEEVRTMSMLTVNADDHPFMKRFHAPGHEKRMVVILEPEDFQGWLTCPVSDAKARYCKQWQGELVGEPAAAAKRAKPAAKVTKKNVPPAPDMGATGDLF